MRPSWPVAGLVAAAALCYSSTAGQVGEADSETQLQLRALRQQNEAFQQQLQKQQEVIDDLTRKVSALQPAATETKVSAGAADQADRAVGPSPLQSAMGKVRLSGEAGVGFFESQSQGQYPNGEFRVDEAKLFLDAPVWENVYFFTELNLVTREDPTAELSLGEAYVDVEDLSQLWKQDRQLNLRLGRMDIPFGEEYMTRDAIDNPLISHSIMDFWGVDEGLELYGSASKFQYVLAVQNGGASSLRDYTGDKSVTARVGVDPTKWLHGSVSAMRTGQLSVSGDRLSALWLGQGFVHSIGSPLTTEFEANLLQGDVQVKLPRTTFHAAGGVLEYKDNDPLGHNQRQVYYYSVEAIQKVYGRLYAAGRWSQAFADKGFPIIGNGNVGDYFGRELTRELSLMSVALGYHWSDQLLLKTEYSWEYGSTQDGTPRSHENLFAIMAAIAY